MNDTYQETPEKKKFSVLEIVIIIAIIVIAILLIFGKQIVGLFKGTPKDERETFVTEARVIYNTATITAVKDAQNNIIANQYDSLNNPIEVSTKYTYDIETLQNKVVAICVSDGKGTYKIDVKGINTVEELTTDKVTEGYCTIGENKKLEEASSIMEANNSSNTNTNPRPSNPTPVTPTPTPNTNINIDLSFKHVIGFGTDSMTTIKNGTVYGIGKDNGELSGIITSGKCEFGTVKNSMKKSVNGTYKLIAVGYNHVCALDTNGDIWSWGSDMYGELGLGRGNEYYNATKCSTYTIAKITNNIGNRKFKDLVAGERHTLAIDTTGYLWSWGNSSLGALGNAGTQSTSPMLIKGGTKFKYIAAAKDISMAIDVNGQLWAWGNNSNGQLGDGTTTNKSAPVSVMGGKKVVNIATGGYHSMAIDESGKLWAWGNSSYGQITTLHSTPTPTNILSERKFVDIATGYYHSLAIDEDGNLWAWGSNQYGQLGDGTSNQSSAPVQIMAGIKFKNVYAGYYASSAVDEDGEQWTWGRNYEKAISSVNQSVIYSPNMVMY